MKNQTAVELYNIKVIELMSQREQGNIDVLEFRNRLDLLFEQAKEMEKDQMKEWWDNFLYGSIVGIFVGITIGFWMCNF